MKDNIDRDKDNVTTILLNFSCSYIDGPSNGNYTNDADLRQ